MFDENTLKNYMNYDYILKILVIGDVSCGKTSLINRFCDLGFSHTYDTTIGVDINLKFFEENNKTYKIYINDVNGLEKFISITRCYYKSTEGFILVFDISDKKSFENIKFWLNDVNEHTNFFIPKILVGTKKDLVSKRQVSYEEAKEFADSQNIEYCEVSSKTSDNDTINKVFKKIIKEVRYYNSYKEKEKEKVHKSRNNCFSCFHIPNGCNIS